MDEFSARTMPGTMMIAPFFNISGTSIAAEEKLGGVAAFQHQASLVLFLLILMGYPVVATGITLIGIESQTITIPYRVAVVAFAALTLASGLFFRLRGRLSWAVLLFMAAYLWRLVYDYFSKSIAGNDLALITFLGMTCFPVIACCKAGISYHSDRKLAKYLLSLGMIVVVGALSAQALGLAYNPWTKYGHYDVRLGFEALNPISLGTAAATVFLAAVFLFFDDEQGRGWRLTAFFSLAASGYLVLEAGSRGALLCMVISIIWYTLTKRKQAIYAIPLMMLAVPFLISDSLFLESFINTLRGGYSTDISALERFDAQNVAWQDFLSSPIFGMHFFNPLLQEGQYPHSLFYETAMAMGIFGLAILCVIFFRLAKALYGMRVNNREFIGMLFIQVFSGTFLSGSIMGLSSFFLLSHIILTNTGRDTVQRSMK